MMFKKKKKAEKAPQWYYELLDVARKNLIDEWYCYIPGNEVKWLDKVPDNISCKIDMKISTESKNEYYCSFHF